MAAIPQPRDHTASAIAAAIEARQENDWESVGIAAGMVGTECDRALWYEFRRASKPEAIDWRTRRIFERGHIEEERLLDLLRLIGCTVRNQQERVQNCNGHVRGKIDAIGTGIPEAPVKEHVIECKSSNAKSYKALVKNKVQVAKPLHYATMQFYMHECELDRALYIVTNKDTEEIYTERVRYDGKFTRRLLDRLQRIIATDEPPSKLHEDPNAKMAFGCKSCRHLNICHNGTWPRVNCRTCLHSTAEPNAHWSCARWNKPLSLDEQEAACPSHLYLPGLVPGTQTNVNAEDEWVEYELRDGTIWRDGLLHPELANGTTNGA